MRNGNTIEKLTAYLNGNRGIAETFINQASGYVDNAVADGDLDDYGVYELYDYFWNIVYDADKEDDAIYNLVDVLKALHNQWGQRSDTYGFLADLMVTYYEYEYLD